MASPNAQSSTNSNERGREEAATTKLTAIELAAIELAAKDSAIARFDARTTSEEKLEKLEHKEGKVPQPERIRSSPEATWYLTPHLEGKVQKGSDNDHSKHRKKHTQWIRPKSKRSTPISK